MRGSGNSHLSGRSRIWALYVVCPRAQGPRPMLDAARHSVGWAGAHNRTTRSRPLAVSRCGGGRYPLTATVLFGHPDTAAGAGRRPRARVVQACEMVELPAMAADDKK